MFSPSSMDQQEMEYLGKIKTDTFSCYSGTLETLDCALCEFTTDLKVELNEHFRFFHQVKDFSRELDTILKLYRCRNCHFGTHSLLVFTQHVHKNRHEVFDKAIKKKKWFKCGQCAYKAKLNRVLQTHIRKHSRDTNPLAVWFSCEQCPYKTVLAKSLELHMKNKHPYIIEPQNLILIKVANCLYAAKPEVDPPNEIWFNCEQCPYKTMLERSLERHIKHKHFDSEPRDAVCFKCEHCSYETRNKCNFQRHNLFRHSNIEPRDAKKFRCEYCPYRAKARNNLDRHLLSKHPDLVPCSLLECKHCSYKTPLKDNLKLHMKAKHFDLEPHVVVWYMCEHCSYKTTIKYNLKSHVRRRHSDLDAQNVRWFTCEHCCSYQSKFISDLRRHQSAVHPDLVVRSWLACGQCSYKTTARRDLKAHAHSKHGLKQR